MQDTLDKIKVASARVLSRHVHNALIAAHEQIEAQTSGFVAAKIPALKENADATVSRFKQHLYNYFDQLTSGTPFESDQTPDASDSLSLLDHDYIEAMIAMEGMIRHMREQESATAAEFLLRLNAFSPDGQIDESNNPLDPEQIGDCFNQAIRPLGLKAHFLLTIYREFNKNVFAHFDAIFDKLNHLLATLEELPQIPKRGAASDALDSEEGQTGTPDADEASDNPPENEQEPPLATAPQRPADAHPSSDTTTATSDTTLLAALNHRAPSQLPLLGKSPDLSVHRDDASFLALQRSLAQLQHPDGDSAEQIHRQIREQIQAILAADGVPALDRVSLNALNLTALFFDRLIEDQCLSEAARKLVLRLQHPLCRAALADPDLFETADHPALAIIDFIARAGIHWADSTDVESLVEFGVLHSAISRCRQIEASDVSAWQVEYETLCEGLSDKLGTAGMDYYRTGTSRDDNLTNPEKISDRDKAEDYASELIRERIFDKQLDPAIRSMLQTHFHNALVKILLKEGAQGKFWKPVLQTIDVMLWSVQTEKQRGDKARFLKIRDRLMANVEKALQFSDVSRTKQNRALRQLKQVQDYTFLRAESGSDSIQSNAGFAIDDASHSALANDDQHVIAIDNFSTGEWFQFQSRSGEVLRAKLSIRIDSIEKLIFVDQQGQKALEFSKRELALQLKTGIVTPLGTGKITQRVLRRIRLDLQP